MRHDFERATATTMPAGLAGIVRSLGTWTGTAGRNACGGVLARDPQEAAATGC